MTAAASAVVPPSCSVAGCPFRYQLKTWAASSCISVTIAQRSTILPPAIRHRAKPWNAMRWPVSARVPAHRLQTTTLSPSASVSCTSTTTWALSSLQAGRPVLLDVIGWGAGGRA